MQSVSKSFLFFIIAQMSNSFECVFRKHCDSTILPITLEALETEHITYIKQRQVNIEQVRQHEK